MAQPPIENLPKNHPIAYVASWRLGGINLRDLMAEGQGAGGGPPPTHIEISRGIFMPLEARLKATLPLLQSTPHRDQAVLEFGRATADFEEFRLRFVVPRDQRPQVQWARDPRTLITNCFDHIRNNSRRAIDAFERSGVYDEAAGTFRFDDASRLEQAMRIYFGAEAATNIGHPTSGPSKGGLLPVILISAGLLGVACAGMWWLMRD